MKFAISNLDIFYISYDEPKADAFYADLCAKSPRPVKRIHGVKGFDAAHRECARQSATSRFVTIDGDNVVNASLFFQQLDDEGHKDLVFSFKARNAVNGLEYGNGGVKVWPKGLVLHVPTHEHAKGEEASTDFCWTYRYYQVNTQMSDVYCNQSPLQAFRSGYREGVKMSLIHGRRLATWAETAQEMYGPNMSRLKVWASVGADVENGWWAIYGTRMGLYDMWYLQGSWAEIQQLITDYEIFRLYFSQRFQDHEPDLAAKAISRRLNATFGMGIVDLDGDQSAWFKSVYINPKREGIMLPQMAPVEFPDD